MRKKSRCQTSKGCGGWAVSSEIPLGKIVSYHDAVHYCQRYNAAISAGLMQAFRILVPDYVERSKSDL